MGDLAADTAVTGGSGRYTADLLPAWDIWGPAGGYVAAVALRAAAADSTLPRPSSLTCHFLSVADFGPVDLEVRTMREARRAKSVRVSMSQRGKPIAEVLTWLVAEGMDGLRHDAARMPEVPGPDRLRTVEQIVGDDSKKALPFWDNIEWKPFEWHPDHESRPPAEPYWRGWYRYRPRATFDDPYVDAARALVLLDAMGWCAAYPAHPGDSGYFAPNLDVTVQFHRAEPNSDWLLAEGFSDVAEDGLVGYRSRLWSASGRLLASGSGQLLCRRGSASSRYV